MIQTGQIRKFKNSVLPNIEVSHIRQDTNEWFCVFQEDFYYPYISLTEEKLMNTTELL